MEEGNNFNTERSDEMMGDGFSSIYRGESAGHERCFEALLNTDELATLQRCRSSSVFQYCHFQGAGELLCQHNDRALINTETPHSLRLAGRTPTREQLQQPSDRSQLRVTCWFLQGSGLSPAWRGGVTKASIKTSLKSENRLGDFL